MSQDSKDPIAAHLALSFAALDRAVHDPQLRASAREIAATIIAALRSGNKLLIIGNGAAPLTLNTSPLRSSAVTNRSGLLTQLSR